MQQRDKSPHLIWPDEPVYCQHPEARESRLVCTHLVGQRPESIYHCWYSGQGYDYYLVCVECSDQLARGKTALELCQICTACHGALEEEGYLDGMIGMPEVPVRSPGLALARQRVSWPLAEPMLDLRPLETSNENAWIALTTTRKLVLVNLTTSSVRTLLYIPPTQLDLTKEVSLHLAPGGQFAALVNSRGQFGIVVDLVAKKISMQLQRDLQQIQPSHFPVAFLQSTDRLLLIHSTAWNRLDISDPRTGELLSARTFAEAADETKPEHYLNYCHCDLSISPDQQWIAVTGRVRQPAGIVTVWNAQRWLQENVWEAENGPSRRKLCDCEQWDEPLCWIDGQTLAVWGYGKGEHLLPAVRLFDVQSGEELRWFAGPARGALICDDHLFSLSIQRGLTAWDVKTGERILAEPMFRPAYYHRGAKQFLQFDAQEKRVILGTCL